MIKHYCDVCGNEITDANRPSSRFAKGVGTQLVGASGVVWISVNTGLKGLWGSGDFCLRCVVDAVTAVAQQACEVA